MKYRLYWRHEDGTLEDQDLAASEANLPTLQRHCDNLNAMIPALPCHPQRWQIHLEGAPSPDPPAD